MGRWVGGILESPVAHVTLCPGMWVTFSGLKVLLQPNLYGPYTHEECQEKCLDYSLR